MKISCPRCHTVYNLPAEKVPAKRAVAQCKRCGAEILIDPAAVSPPGGAAGPEGSFRPISEASAAPERAGTGEPAAPFPREESGGGAPEHAPPSPEGGISIGDALTKGWQAAKGHLWFFFFFMLLAILIPRIPSALQGMFREVHPFASAVLYLISMGLHTLTGMGLLKTSLNLVDGKPLRLEDLFSCAPLFLSYFYGSILLMLILAAGYLLLIIPGIYLTFRYFFFAFAVVDGGLGPVQALKRSADITKGHILKLILFSLVIFGITILGVLPLLLGLFVTVPTTLAAMAHVYRTLSGERPAA